MSCRRCSYVFVLLLITLSLQAQTKNPFLSLKFNKVIIYDYQPTGEDYSLVDGKGQIAKTVQLKKQVQFGKATIDILNKKLGDKKSYEQVTAMCFEPHLGVVYFFNNKIVGYALICMDCNALRSNIDIPAQKQGKQGQGDKAYYLGDGMSKSFRQFLNELLKKYNFSHQVQPSSMFDK